MLTVLKEKINVLEEKFNEGNFQSLIDNIPNVLDFIKNMTKIFISLKLYQEIYDVGS